MSNWGNRYSFDFMSSPKFDLPKYEPPKFEYPKRDLPKFELPKPAPIKFDFPKFEPPKFEYPKRDLPKFELPKPEPMKFDFPKFEPPKFEYPKRDLPKPEPIKFDLPKFEPPKFEHPKFDLPKPEPIRFESPKIAAPYSFAPPLFSLNDFNIGLDAMLAPPKVQTVIPLRPKAETPMNDFVQPPLKIPEISNQNIQSNHGLNAEFNVISPIDINKNLFFGDNEANSGTQPAMKAPEFDIPKYAPQEIANPDNLGDKKEWIKKTDKAWEPSLPVIRTSKPELSYEFANSAPDENGNVVTSHLSTNGIQAPQINISKEKHISGGFEQNYQIGENTDVNVGVKPYAVYQHNVSMPVDANNLKNVEVSANAAGAVGVNLASVENHSNLGDVKAELDVLKIAGQTDVICSFDEKGNVEKAALESKLNIHAIEVDVDFSSDELCINNVCCNTKIKGSAAAGMDVRVSANYEQSKPNPIEVNLDINSGLNLGLKADISCNPRQVDEQRDLPDTINRIKP